MECDSSKQNTFFWLFILIHTLIWTLGPYLLRPTLPHDTLEGITWGLQWQWGYNKHPFLTAWLCAGIAKLLGNTSWSVYLLAQISISATFITLWKLAQHMVSKTHALIAALTLEGVFFYNINSFNMTPDTLQSPLWALLCLFFYKALNSPYINKMELGNKLLLRIFSREKTKLLLNWSMVGFCAALCFCAKYQSLMLFFTLFLFCVINPQARQSLKKPELYYSLVLFLVLISPHLVWLYQHQFITFFYATGISSEYTLNKNFLGYFIYPLKFLLNSFLNVSGIFVLLWPFYNLRELFFSCGFYFKAPFEHTVKAQPQQIPHPERYEGRRNQALCSSETPHCVRDDLLQKTSSKTQVRELSERSKDAFDKQFLLFISLGPLFLTLMCCSLTGNYFPPRWATPYFFPLSLLILIYMKPQVTPKKLKLFLITIIMFSSLLFTIRMSTFIFFPRSTSDAFLPNKSIASFITQLWDKQYHKPLPFLAGSHYLVAGVLPYISNKPIPYLSWDTKDSSWIKEQQIHRQGGIFIWDIGGYYTWDKLSKTHRGLPNSILKRFPKLKIQPNFVVLRLSDKQPIVIGIAILPPDPLWSYNE